jgi:hypothetical protein
MANQQQQLLFKRRFSSCQHTALVWPTAQMPSPVWASQPFHTLYPFVPGSPPPPPSPPRAAHACPISAQKISHGPLAFGL